jgi:cell wall-active antibiotic response 4TMS protein YvqF/uncharacterized protein DUF1707
MPPSELERERVIQALCSHYANDNLSTQELEARFDLAYKAATSDDLQALVGNLPPLPPIAVTRTARISTPFYGIAPAGEAAPERRTLALMSEVKKVGEWIPARRNVVHAIMGSAELDLREALLSQGEIEIVATAIMGEVKIIVPPGLRVECDGTAIMGEFKELHSAVGEDPTAPLVRIHGMALMGSVTVTTRLPGESALAAWRRRKREKGRV